MRLYDLVPDRLKNAVIKNLTDETIIVEFAGRFGKKTKKASDGIIPFYTSQQRVSLDNWRDAVIRAENPLTRNRYNYYVVVDNAMLDLHLSSIIETRILEVQHTKFKLMDQSRKEDLAMTELLQRNWYLDYIKYAMESIFYGYSLVELWDLKEQITTTGKTNTGVKQVKEFKEATLIDRAHVSPEYKTWRQNVYDLPERGIDYTEKTVAPYYIGIGCKSSLGMLKKITPIVLAKRYALGAWGDFDEKLGVPFRTVTMQGTDAKREKMLGEIMDKMGYAGWAILHESEKIELLQASGSDVHKCFKELIELTDRQMSKVVLGSTMTADAEGGNYKGEVHQATTEIRHMADKVFIKYLNNEELIPRLIKRGYPLEGYTYDLDDTKDMSPTEQIAIDTVLLQHYNIAPKYIAEKYDIPVEMLQGKSGGNVQDILTETSKKKVSAKGISVVIGEYSGAIINRVNKVYFGNSCCEKHDLKGHISATTPSYSLIEKVIKGVFSGQFKGTNLHEGLFDWQVKSIFKALKEGSDNTINEIYYQDSDPEVVQFMKENIFVFSAFKSYQELKAMSELLIDESGNLKEYSKFKNDALQVHQTYDQRFLRAEYDHAVASSQMAMQWQRIVKDKALYPYLKYNAVADGGTTALCLSLNGITLPVDHDFWNRYFPPNHWGCRSTVDQDQGTSITSKFETPEIDSLFNGNVGKTGIIFPSKHPYFEVSKKTSDALTSFAKSKFKNNE
jgi:SPP1 gp7 family putative phage head morphogenesis protein